MSKNNKPFPKQEAAAPAVETNVTAATPETVVQEPIEAIDVIEDTPAIGEEAPAVTEDGPAVEEAPAVTEDGPAVEEAAPTVTEAAPAVTEEATPTVVEEAPAVEEAAAESTPEQRIIAALKVRFPNLVEFDADTKNIIGVMEEFIGNMAPNQVITVERGTMFQRNLYNAILEALSIESWTLATEVVLYYFTTYRNAHFQPRLLMRFSDRLNMNRNDLMRFNALLSLYAAAADPLSRNTVSSQIDFERLASMFTDSDIKVRLLAVFKI